MSILQSVILGLVQGLTEFIPVSSSGHLVLVSEIFGWEDQGIAFDIVLHLATLVAVVVYFWREWGRMLKSFGIWFASLFSPSLRSKISKEDGKLFLYILIGTIPAVPAGLFLEEYIEGYFRSIFWVSLFMILTGLLFVVLERGRRFYKHKREEKGQEEFGTDKISELGILKSLFIGVMQSLGIFPGVSRSGITIAGGFLSGLSRQAAARFSFLLSVPAIIGAGTIGIKEISGKGFNGGILPIHFIIGFAVSLFAGYFSIKWMLRFLKHEKLYVFAIYLIMLGLFMVAYTKFKG